MTTRWLALTPVVCLTALLLATSAQTAYAFDDQPPAEAAAAPADAAAEAKPWTEMSVEEKLDALQKSAVKLDDDGKVSNDNLYGETDLLWMCIAAFLVFFMQAGFALVETGFTRAKNCVNIIMKNVMDFVIGSLVFWALGFGLMFGANNGGFFGTTDFLVSGIGADGSLDSWTFGFWIFQCVFAATAATIVSGAMAERTQFIGYLIYSALISAFIYPIFGSWAWGGLWHGGGWLEGKGFIDFAGSTVVHSVGGWAALAGAILIGPRIGKYTAEGKPLPIPGHSMPLAALGVFILWLGWFGFNPGSTTAVGGGDFARVAVTTNLAACAGALSCMIAAWIRFGKPDVSFTLNGALAGLVAITSPCYNVGPGSAIAIGAVAGVLVLLSVLFIDRIGIDDPVGAISVHGVCGAWGTLSAGLFAHELYGGGPNGLLFGGGMDQLITQLIGIGACFAWTFPMGLIVFGGLKAAGLLRVKPEEEMQGLDIGEHGMEAYNMG